MQQMNGSIALMNTETKFSENVDDIVGDKKKSSIEVKHPVKLSLYSQHVDEKECQKNTGEKKKKEIKEENIGDSDHKDVEESKSQQHKEDDTEGNKNGSEQETTVSVTQQEGETICPKEAGDSGENKNQSEQETTNSVTQHAEKIINQKEAGSAEESKIENRQNITTISVIVHAEETTNKIQAEKPEGSKEKNKQEIIKDAVPQKTQKPRFKFQTKKKQSSLDSGSADLPLLPEVKWDDPFDEGHKVRKPEIKLQSRSTVDYSTRQLIEETVFAGPSTSTQYVGDFSGPLPSSPTLDYHPHRHLKELHVDCSYDAGDLDSIKPAPASPPPYDSRPRSPFLYADAVALRRGIVPGTSRYKRYTKEHDDEISQVDPAIIRACIPGSSGYSQGNVRDNYDLNEAARAEAARRYGAIPRTFGYGRGFSIDDYDEESRKEISRRQAAIPRSSGFGRGYFREDYYDEAARAEAARKYGAIPRTSGYGRGYSKEEYDGSTSSRKSRRDGKKKKIKENTRCCNKSRSCQCPPRKVFGREVAHQIFDRAVAGSEERYDVRAVIPQHGMGVGRRLIGLGRPRARAPMRHALLAVREARAPNIVVHPPAVQHRDFVQDILDAVEAARAVAGWNHRNILIGVWEQILEPEHPWREQETSRGGFAAKLDLEPRRTPTEPRPSCSYDPYPQNLPRIECPPTYPVSDYDGILPDDKFTDGDVAVLVSMDFDRKLVIYALRANDGDRLQALRELRTQRTSSSAHNAVWRRTEEPTYRVPFWDQEEDLN